jgi:hypothetical protein
MKFWHDTSKGKVMLEVIFDWKDIVHHTFIPEGATVNKEKYDEMLSCLWETIHPETWEVKDCMVLLVNVQAYQMILTKRHILLLLHLPDLTLCNVYLFPQIKDWLKSCHLKK